MSAPRSIFLKLVIAAAGVAMAGCQWIAARAILPREDVRKADYQARIERNIPLTTSDGVVLVADLYKPDTSQPAPTILLRVPFTKTLKNSLGADAVGKFWASHGYIVMLQGTRGRYKSAGTNYPLIHERQDGLDTLQWLGRQPWFDGRLGMWGGSAFGHTQWVLADQSDPGPTALMIQIASTDFYEMFHPDGAFSLESALFWAARSRGVKDRNPSIDDLERGFSGFPLIAADDRGPGTTPFFKDWATHSQRDDYWRAIDGEDRARSLKAPVLLMAGWSDPFLPTQLRDFETIQQHADPRIAAESRLIVGPWSHADAMKFPDGSTAGSYRRASLAPSLPWFDHQLLHRPIDRSLAAPVKIYVLGENVWRDEQEWPLARTRYTSFYLSSGGHANSARGDGVLIQAEAGPNEPADSFVYDPRQPVSSHGGAMLGPRAGIYKQNDVEQRDDVLVYSTEPLTLDTEVTGPIAVVLSVATNAPNTDFTAKLVDVDADGSAYNVSDGILRRDYAHGTGATPEEITIHLWPTSMLFRSGHRIRLEVSSSNYPRYDRNPNTGADVLTETEPRQAAQQVFHDSVRASRIILPLIPRPVSD
jgi:putative CocE/NonD family hydrolase